MRHVPLIHGADGAKLSKRHGALGVETYRDELGILPEALFNYLLRLGWGHGDDEIISREQAVAMVRPRRMSARRRRASTSRSSRISTAIICARPIRRGWPPWSRRRSPGADADLLARAMPVLTPRAKDLNELAEGAAFLFKSVPARHGRESGLPASRRRAGPARAASTGAGSGLATGRPRRRSRRCGRWLRPPASKLGQVAQPLAGGADRPGDLAGDFRCAGAAGARGKPRPDRRRA